MKVTDKAKIDTLRLTRETLRALDSRLLSQAIGGGPNPTISICFSRCTC